MCVDPITRQIYDNGTSTPCENYPRNIIELDSDSDDKDLYILRPDPIKRKPHMLTPSQIKTRRHSNTFTAQDVRYNSLHSFHYISFYTIHGDDL